MSKLKILAIIDFIVSIPLFMNIAHLSGVIGQLDYLSAPHQWSASQWDREWLTFYDLLEYTSIYTVYSAVNLYFIYRLFFLKTNRLVIILGIILTLISIFWSWMYISANLCTGICL